MATTHRPQSMTGALTIHNYTGGLESRQEENGHVTLRGSKAFEKVTPDDDEGKGPDWDHNQWQVVF